MSNQLIIPFKVSRPVDIKSSVKLYIERQHPETHPDAFRADVEQWEALRKDAISGGVHVSRINSLLRYQAQLVFILTKLPADIGLEVSYDPVFRTRSTSPLSAPNLYLELVGTVFNLASLYSQLARSQDRSQPDGVRLATQHNLSAASALAHIVEKLLPSLQASYGQPLPIDMTAPFFESLKWLTLAQAQESGLGKAISNNASTGLRAKIAMGVAERYNSAWSAIEDSVPSVANAFPSEWRAHLQIKALQFEAFAHQQLSMDNNANGLYGVEVGRLQLAAGLAKRASEKANATSGVAKSVKDEVTKLRNDIAKELATASKDNDLIYHKDVPSPEALPKIAGIDLAKATSIEELEKPGFLVGPSRESPIFGDLLAHGARAAIELYKDRLSNYIKDNVVDVREDLDTDISKKLHELSLPAALDALDKKIGLPPSLLAKAEEIRQNEGNKKIESLMQDVATMSLHCREAIHAAARILEAEAQQDAMYQLTFGSNPQLAREPSNRANHDLLQDTLKFQQAFMTATDSDTQIRDAWLRWRETIDLLAGSEAEIESAVPSSSSAGSASATILPYARELRRLLEELDDLKSSRTEVVNAARHMAAIDDIRRRIELEASAMERWVEVKPAMFEDTITSELEKYDKYQAQLEEGGRKQAALLKKIETANTKFIDSRKRDPSVEQREQALATLYTAFNEYKKTIGDLSQGLEFYNKLSVVTTQLAENCRVWAAERDAEVKRVHEALRQAAAAPAVATAAQPNTSVIAPLPEPAQVQHERADVVMTSPRGQPSPSLPMSVTSPTPSTRTFKPKSKFVQNALGSRATPATPSAPAPTAGPSSDSLPSPWKPAVYARELNAAGADWEDEEARNVSPTKPIAHELGNLNDSADWDDGPVLPSPVASTPLKGSGKKTGNSNRSLNSTDRTPSGKTKTRSGRVPAT